MRREITGVGRVAKAAVALLVRGMLDRVGGELVAGHAELIGGRRETDKRRPLNVADRVANIAAHRTAVCTYFPDALSLWHSRHLEGSTLVGRRTGWW